MAQRSDNHRTTNKRTGKATLKGSGTTPLMRVRMKELDKDFVRQSKQLANMAKKLKAKFSQRKSPIE